MTEISNNKKHKEIKIGVAPRYGIVRYVRDKQNVIHTMIPEMLITRDLKTVIRCGEKDLKNIFLFKNIQNIQ